MILHGHPTAELWRGNTLAAPYFKNSDNGLRTFDFAVANPPFSDKAWTTGLSPTNDEYHRFEFGVPPTRNGDYAFLLHLIASLKSKGKGAIIMPHGVLFRGNREGDIRRNLIRRGLIKGIVRLPANLFYGTGIPACIVVIDKENSNSRNSIFMVDASNGFIKDGNKNRLRAQDIHQIVDVFNKQTELPGYSRIVPVDEIASPGNDYNLNIPRYVDSTGPEDLHDLTAHFKGGIPDRDIDGLDAYWEVFPTLRQTLFERNGRPGYSEARVETPQVKAAIYDHKEFRSYREQVAALFNAWSKRNKRLLSLINSETLPRAVINGLSEDLLKSYAGLPLLKPYDIYQRLMDYWESVMQDDVYLIVSEGWIEASRPRNVLPNRDKKLAESPDLTVKGKKYKMDLVTPSLMIERYFPNEQSNIDALESHLETAALALEEFAEEHTGDDGHLKDAVGAKGTVTKTRVNALLKALPSDDDPEIHEERDILCHWLKLFDSRSDLDKAVKSAQSQLDEQMLARFETLTLDEIKTLLT